MAIVTPMMKAIRPSPREIFDMYSSEEKYIVDWIWPVVKWRECISYQKIKCLYFSMVDRGIECWKLFNEFLHRSFPNLQSLILEQDYTSVEICNEALKKQHFTDFFNDPWLKDIIISVQQLGDRLFSYPYTPPENCLRVFHCDDMCSKCWPGSDYCDLKAQMCMMPCSREYPDIILSAISIIDSDDEEDDEYSSVGFHHQEKK